MAGARDQPSPTYYLPASSFAEGVLQDADGASWCEWKGQASYFDLVTATAVAPRAAWTYRRPTPGFAAITGAVAVMAAAVDRCIVNGEEAVPQPGGFYGGWINSWVAGPFKGFPARWAGEVRGQQPRSMTAAVTMLLPADIEVPICLLSAFTATGAG